MILIGAVAALILVFIMGEIWYFFLREKPAPPTISQQEILPPPQELQPLLPPAEELAAEELTTEDTSPEISTPTAQPAAGLLNYTSTSVINLADLKMIFQTSVGKDELVKLIIKTGETDSLETENAGNEIATLDELAKYLKIKIPLSIKNQSTGEFDILAFGGNTFDQDTCAKAKNTAVSCYGPRLGLALKIIDPVKTKAALKIWESTLATDLKTLILAKVGAAATPAFQTGTYQGQTIRYKNLPLNTATVEYALVDNILIITTSKNSMLKAIDSLNTNNDESGE